MKKKFIINTRVGIIEIGSRALRLLVADISTKKGFTVVSTDWRETQLAETIELGNSAIRTKTLEIKNIVHVFLEKCRQLQVSRVCVFGTEAVRQISRKKLYDISNIMPFVIILDKKSEALCSLTAATKGLPDVTFHDNSVLTIDQGAGSMELAVGQLSSNNINLVSCKSYNLGTKALVELLMKNKGCIQKFREEIQKKIIRYKLFEKNTSSHAIVLGSAATKSAWIKVRGQNLNQRYAPSRVHGQIVTVRDIESLVKASIDNSDLVRRIIDPFNPNGNEFEIIITGLVTLSIFLQKLGKNEFYVSGWGTRHGIAWMLAYNDPRLQWAKNKVINFEALSSSITR